MKLFNRKPKQPKPSVAPPEYTYPMGGWWGNRIEWFTCDPGKQIYRFTGWKPYDQFPKEGDTVMSEFQHSWCWFVLTKIDPCRDPRDMFFADAAILHREMKSEFPESPDIRIARAQLEPTP
jgi:hypothetical protein